MHQQQITPSTELPPRHYCWSFRMLLWWLSLSVSMIVGLTSFVEAADLLNWCVVGDEELGMCNRLAKYLNQYDDSGWGCYKASSIGGCIVAVEEGNADFVTLDPGKAYVGYKYHGLFAVVSLTSGSSDVKSSAAAVVKADFCGNGTLKGKVSCHSGYRELAGWYAPIGMMLNNGSLKPIDQVSEVNNDVESAQSYFARSCAPGDETGPGTCSACSTSTGCSHAEEAYAGPFGAMDCLVNGGDVAFVGGTTVLEYLNGERNRQMSGNMTKERFRHLCWNGTCMPVDDPATCVWLEIPHDLVMTRIGLADSVREKAVAVLIKLSKMEDFHADLFSPSKNPKGLIFEPGTTGMIPVTDNIENILGKEVLQAIAAVDRLDLPVTGLTAANESAGQDTVTWCAVGNPELQACEEFKLQLNNVLAANISWRCAMQDTVEDCLTAVQNGTADVLSVSADVLFLAVHYYGLSAIMSEKCYDASTGGFWTVAVVRKEVCDQNPALSFADLKGKRSCHGSGYGDVAGWVAPVATIANQELVKMGKGGKSQTFMNDKVVVTQFFSSVCAPGTPHSELCTGCRSGCPQGQAISATDAIGVDCLNDGGDVAFIRCPRNMAPGIFEKIDTQKYRLLCAHGGCANTSEVDVCNFFFVPFKAVVVRSSMHKSVVDNMTATLEFVSKGEKFKAMFGEGTNTRSLLFSQSILWFTRITETTDEYLDTSLDMFATYNDFHSPSPGDEPLPYRAQKTRDLTIIYIITIVVASLIAIGLCVFCYFRSRKVKENIQSRQRAMEYTRPDWEVGT